MAYVRGSRSDFDAWSKVAPGWSWNDVLPHFQNVEQTMKVLIGEASEFINDLFTAAAQYGLPHNPNYNTSESQYGYALFQFNVTGVSNLIRETTYSTFQPEQYQNVTVHSMAFVTRILFEDTRAIGVEYIKERQQHLAYIQNEIILSAGAIASPKILMLSGIGDENELAKFDIPVVVNVPEVGQNLYAIFLLVSDFLFPKTKMCHSMTMV